MSKVFCDKPFDHNYIHMNGKLRLCCVSIQNITQDNDYNQFDLNNNLIEEYWNCKRMRQIRLDMIKGKEIRDCQRCYEQEQKGLASLRSKNTMNISIQNTMPDGTFLKKANTMQLHMGNICNLKCKMCSQMYSHMVGLELLEMGDADPKFLLWVKEQGAITNNWPNELGKKEQWFKNTEIKNNLFNYISKNITNLNIIGGEPTVIPEFYELLEKCFEDNTLKNKSISLMTNLTNTNPNLINWLDKTKFWNIFASLDGLNERNEYIRYPSKWENILKNLNFYKSLLTGTKNTITLSPAIQLLNVDQLDDIIKWWTQFSMDNPKKNFNINWGQTVWYPKMLNYDIAPMSYKKLIHDKLKKFDYQDIYYQNLLKNLQIDAVDKTEQQYCLKTFVKYNDAQDRFRNVTKTWRQLLPELEKSIIDELSQ
jgi:organic radical activating enzyme